jgi:putative glycerol-1-phosphate prenyltransferase
MVGGGIRTGDDAKRIFSAGADIIVVGSAIETNPDSIEEFSIARYTV